MIPRLQRISLGPTILLTAFLLTGLAPHEALATLTSVDYTVDSSYSEGPVAAKITFTAGNGVLTIAVTNTETDGGSTYPQMVLGQAVSAFQFVFSPPSGVSQPSAFTLIQGASLITALPAFVRARNTVRMIKNGGETAENQAFSGPGAG